MGATTPSGDHLVDSGKGGLVIHEKFQWACQLLKEATEENRAVREQFEELLLETDRLKL